MTDLHILSVGPGVTVQDLGRSGHIASGLSQGGAADRLALAEGAALLRQPPDLAALEMAGFGGSFTATAPLRIALTGAPMAAAIDGAPIAWNASHLLPAGETLTIGGARAGVYGYLTLGGGIDTVPVLGARAAHLAAGIGTVLEAGQSLPLGPDLGGPVGEVLPVQDRFQGGTARILASLQTDLFDAETLARFTRTCFCRDARANRQGVRLVPEGEGFGLSSGQSILSEIITKGDIQIPGDGAPYVLLPEAQTTGGYPRIGTVIPADLPMLAQIPAGAAVRFAFVTLDQALDIEAKDRAMRLSLAARCHPRLRAPEDIADLLSYQLISGMITGTEDL
ncbi:urea amidolyase (plasmid) [Pseudorhodobacter turbinis]|uniref:Urea amidolyase n=1 Tax=Pseudorhodobacter turbinis TaxID=2500533 RepID=A0A4P8EIT7_9RHOB|nr:urea amidolyase [Pseudorhodobacter turbinis]QCO57080.1 urea amidolyase [Pseudorhodobacter turbinis]